MPPIVNNGAEDHHGDDDDDDKSLRELLLRDDDDIASASKRARLSNCDDVDGQASSAAPVVNGTLINPTGADSATLPQPISTNGVVKGESPETFSTKQSLMSNGVLVANGSGLGTATGNGVVGDESSGMASTSIDKTKAVL